MPVENAPERDYATFLAEQKQQFDDWHARDDQERSSADPVWNAAQCAKQIGRLKTDIQSFAAVPAPPEYQAAKDQVIRSLESRIDMLKAEERKSHDRRPMRG